jgi:hypothetical protein
MVPRLIGTCVECPKCRTLYIIGANPYGNGSFISSCPTGDPDLRRLYCSCTGPFGYFPFKLSQLRTYAVSEPAHVRGYGSGDEMVPLGDTKKRAS